VKRNRDTKFETWGERYEVRDTRNGGTRNEDTTCRIRGMGYEERGYEELTRIRDTGYEVRDTRNVGTRNGGYEGRGYEKQDAKYGGPRYRVEERDMRNGDTRNGGTRYEM
jgi:hypothetical protein